MVAKARTNAERRASDKINQSYDVTTVNTGVNIIQNIPDATVSLSPSSHSSSCTSRFDSWILLCQGTGRQYPTADDIFHSTSYAKKPGNFSTKLRAHTNAE